MLLENKIGIVTGAVGGIGEATVHRFCKEGCKVVATDILEDKLNDLVKHLTSSGYQAVAIPADVTDLDSVERMTKSALETFGQVDILVNIVGGAIAAQAAPFAQSRKEWWDRIINLNLYSTMNCCRAVINHMIERRSGKIVSVASMAGMRGQAKTADYAAAKAGVIGFTMSLAKEVAEYNINVNCISPGFVATPRVKSFPKDFTDKIKQSIYLKRLAKPEEVAGLLAFLASNEADYLTGANYLIDGGATLGP